jgi:hypothetical protein
LSSCLGLRTIFASVFAAAFYDLALRSVTIGPGAGTGSAGGIIAAASLADFFTSSFAAVPRSGSDASRASAARVESSDTESLFAENLLETLPKTAPMIKAAAMRNSDDKMNMTMIRYPTSCGYRSQAWVDQPT